MRSCQNVCNFPLHDNTLLFGDCDTLVIVLPFESDNLNRGLVTVRASSAHGMGTKKPLHDDTRFRHVMLNLAE